MRPASCPPSWAERPPCLAAEQKPQKALLAPAQAPDSMLGAPCVVALALTLPRPPPHTHVPLQAPAPSSARSSARSPCHCAPTNPHARTQAPAPSLTRCSWWRPHSPCCAPNTHVCRPLCHHSHALLPAHLATAPPRQTRARRPLRHLWRAAHGGARVGGHVVDRPQRPPRHAARAGERHGAALWVGVCATCTHLDKAAVALGKRGPRERAVALDGGAAGATNQQPTACLRRRKTRRCSG